MGEGKANAGPVTERRVTAVWVLPVAAGSFGGGIVLLGGALGPRSGLGVIVFGSFVLLVSVIAARPAGVPYDPLVGSGLVHPPALSPRERVLAAAGIAARPEASPRESRATRLGLAAALVSGFLLLGAGWSAIRIGTGTSLPGLTGRHARFWGTAASDPRRFEFGWGIEATLERAQVDGRILRFRARGWIRARARPPPVEPGQPLFGAGVLHPVEPEASGFEEYLSRRGVQVTVSAREFATLGPPENPALRAANAARRSLRKGALLVLPEREAGLFLGLSVGDLGQFDSEVEEDFLATGLGHLVAVSGSNVVMFLTPVLGIAALLRLSTAARFALGLGAVVFFALLTRWEPSVLRASVMAGIVLLGVLAGRPRSTIAAIGGAALILLIADPGLASSLGFQLSVAATAGIAALATPLAARMPWLPRPLAIAVAATVGAQIAVTPLLLVAFGAVPTVTLVANVLAFAAVPLALLAGLLAAGAALLWVPVGIALGKVAVVPLGYLIGLADLLARAPLPTVAAGGIVLPALVAVAGIALVWRLRRGRRRLATGVSLAVTAGFIWIGAAGAGSPDSLVVTFFDVGQGDAALVQTPEGVTLLIDAGEDEQLMGAKLAGLGVKRIDVAVATHAHADHIGGFPAVFARYPVGTLLEPGCPADSPIYDRFLDAASDEGIPVDHPRGGDQIRAGGLDIEVLGPDRCSGEPNDDSVVLRLTYREGTVLFTGDAEVPAQEDLLEDADPIGADVLKVPHHGGDTSLDTFLQQVGAVVAIVSVGENDYGHPVPSVLQVLERTGARVIRTDLAGDVTVRFGPEGLHLESAA